MENSPFDWPAIYAARRQRLRQRLRDCGLDALLVSHAANRFYLSGFELSDGQPGETAGMLVITADGYDWLATDSRFLEEACKHWPRERIFIYKNMERDLAALLRRAGAVIGLDGKSVSAHLAARLRAYCDILPAFADGWGLVESLRVIKEPCEIAALRKSFALNHRMLAWIGENIASLPGQSEREIAWEIEKFFRQNGAQALAFDTIVASGKNGSCPHARPGADKLPQNGALLIDLGCRVDNYCSDQTRTYWIGPQPDARFEKALELVRGAQAAVIAAIGPGMPCAQADAIARDYLARAGAADAFTHGLGHGIGLETHEAPSLSARCDKILRAGMVVTVEPGLYYPEWGGVRWEHTILVTEDGAEIL